MSSTRSPSRKAQATELARDALIVSHGQPSDPEPPEKSLAALAVQVGAHMPGWRVKSATLASPQAVESAISDLSENALIYPMFMSDGWFVRSALPKRLGARPFRILPPLGLDQALPEMSGNLVHRTVADKGWMMSETRVLIVGHGSSRSTRAGEATEEFAHALGAHLPGCDLRVGFIEQAPYIQDIAGAPKEQTLCLPFFAFDGEHVRDDIPEALAESGFKGEVLPVFRHYPDLSALIARSFLAAHEMKGAA